MNLPNLRSTIEDNVLKKAPQGLSKFSLDIEKIPSTGHSMYVCRTYKPEHVLEYFFERHFSFFCGATQTG
jgi:hypothetical protein